MNSIFDAKGKVTVWLLVVMGLAPAHSQAARTPPPDRPNFIVILVDDLGYGDVGPFGSKLNRTPQLDRMAKEGMRLTSCYAAPACSPSRAQLLTGCYPKRVGLPNVLFPACPIGLNASETTLPELLKQRGYTTMAIGKWHLGDQPEFLPTRHGFDRFFGLPYSNDMIPASGGSVGDTKDGKRLRLQRPGELGITRQKKPPLPLLREEAVIEEVDAAGQNRITERYTEQAVEFIRENRSAPFFLYLAHTAVHVPLHAGKDFAGKSQNGKYGDWVEEVDWSVGRVLETLRELKLDHKTLVVFTSDNGPWLEKGPDGGSAGPLRAGKGTTWEGGMRVPTIAWWPDRVPSGRSCDAVTATFDLLPTFAHLAGSQSTAFPSIDGRDIWPLLSGETQNEVHDAFYYFRGNNLQAVRSGPWKLVFGGSDGSSQLFNLRSDIGETTNLSAVEQETAHRLAELVTRMDKDLGVVTKGPGVRPAGRVAESRPLVKAGTTFEWEEDPPQDTKR